MTGIEAHYPTEVNEENAHLYQRLQEEAGVRLVAVPFSHFFDKRFEFGSLSNPDPTVREHAIEVAVGGLRLIQEMEAEVAISWPRMDGYRYLHGTPYMAMWDRFEGAMAKGILAAQRIEARLKHPENRRLLEEGHALVGLNPETGHVKMGFEMLPAAFSLVGMKGRLAHTH